MGRYRVPSVTPSVGSDAPIPETLQDDPHKSQIPQGAEVSPKAEDTVIPPVLVLYLGNLHPHIESKDLFELFGHHRITSIVIRNSRGCGVTRIPEEAMVSNDRCYATVGIRATHEALEAVRGYRETPPILRGLSVIIKNSAADMPEASEILERVLSGTKTKRTTRRTRRRIAVEKTERVIEDQQRPLAGPSRRSAQGKSRYTPMCRG